MKWLFSLLGLTIWASAIAQIEDKKKQDIDYRLIVEHETAVGLEVEDFQKSEWMVDPELTWNLNKRIRLFSQFRFYTELTDQLEPGDADFNSYSKWSKPLEIGDRSYLELREFYLDMTIGKSYWRVGKQQVVWGEMDGFKILDQLNPMTFREFILDDFDDSRIPLWSIKGDFKWEKFDFQFFWSPDHSAHVIPGLEAVYSPLRPDITFPKNLEVVEKKIEHPDDFLKDSDFGIQISTFWKGWDLSLNYIYQYDKTALPRQLWSIDGNFLTIEPTMNRQHVIGTSFGKTKGSFGLRGELAVIPNKFFLSMDSSDIEGLIKKDQLISGLAFDYFGLSDAIITFQWFGDFVKNDLSEIEMGRKRLVQTVTIMHTQYLLNQRVEVEIFGGYRFSERGFLLDFKSSYLLQDNFKIWLGGDLFVAENQGLLQSFNTNDRLLVGMEWGIQ